MSQQINLLVPLFRRPRTLFSGRLAVLLVAAVTGALAATSGWDSFRGARLAAEQARLESQRDALAERIAELGRSLAARTAGAGDAELARLAAERDRKAQALALLASREVAATRGFSPQLTGLARQHLDGLWLTRIEFAPGEMALTGVALEPSLLPRYLQLLGAEPVFAGTAFGHARLDRSETAAGVRFELRTRSGSAS